MTDYQKQQQIESKQATARVIKWGTLGGILLLFVIFGLMYGCPKYRVWQQGLEGEAELKRAGQNRQIKVQEAQALRAAAEELAAADTIRAHGISRTQEIIGGSLTDQYLHWFWIDNIEKSPQATIYVPTENNLPIFAKPSQKIIE